MKMRNRYTIRLGIIVLAFLASSSNATLPNAIDPVLYEIQQRIIRAIGSTRDDDMVVWQTRFQHLVNDRFFVDLLNAGISANLIINAARGVVNALNGIEDHGYRPTALGIGIRQMMVLLISVAQEFNNEFYPDLLAAARGGKKR